MKITALESILKNVRKTSVINQEKIIRLTCGNPAICHRKVLNYARHLHNKVHRVLFYSNLKFTDFDNLKDHWF